MSLAAALRRYTEQTRLLCSFSTKNSIDIPGVQLEPGEIDVQRSRAFNRCARNEFIENEKQRQIAESRKRREEREKRKKGKQAEL